ncbi:bifunctional transaldolase/phosoglucose isomerase [compost metagenome]
METLMAFKDHGHPASRLEHNLDKVIYTLEKLKKIDIDLNAISNQLEKEGIDKFNKPYDQLLQAIQVKKVYKIAAI